MQVDFALNIPLFIFMGFISPSTSRPQFYVPPTEPLFKWWSPHGYFNLCPWVRPPPLDPVWNQGCRPWPWWVVSPEEFKNKNKGKNKGKNSTEKPSTKKADVDTNNSHTVDLDLENTNNHDYDAEYYEDYDDDERK